MPKRPGSPIINPHIKDKRGQQVSSADAMAANTDAVGASGGPVEEMDAAADGASSVPVQEMQVLTDIQVKYNGRVHGPPHDSNAYKNCSSMRGLCLIFNFSFLGKHNERRGSEIDVARMESLFTKMNYKTVTYLDLPKQKLMSVLDNIIILNRMRLEQYDSLIVTVMSHGGTDKKNRVIFKTEDEEDVVTKDFIVRFAECIYVQEKPKIFIFQACSGPKFEVPDSLIREQFYSDCFFINAAGPEHYSYRSPTLGSVLIQELVDVFSRHSCEEEITTLMNMVYDRVQEWKMQIPSLEKSDSSLRAVERIDFESRLLKKFFFNPVFSNFEPVEETDAEERKMGSVKDIKVIYPSTVHRPKDNLPFDNTYKNCSMPRGLFLMFNFSFRGEQNELKGSAIDVIRMKYLFTKMNYKTVTYLDLCVQELHEKLHDITKRNSLHLELYDSVIIMVNSHGDSEDNCGDFVYTIDKESVLVEDFLLAFAECNHLEGKPKIFIFDACRGKEEEEYQKKSELDYPDCFDIRASRPKHVSYIHSKLGSYLIQELVTVFSKHSSEEEINTLMEMVEYQVQKREIKSYSKQKRSIRVVQKPDWDSKLKKNFFFNPARPDRHNTCCPLCIIGSCTTDELGKAVWKAVKSDNLDYLMELAQCSNYPTLLQQQRQDGGLTPLHLAAQKNSVVVVLALLNIGVDFNATDALGYTPLHHAAALGHLTAVKVLVDWGAEASLLNSDGDRPVDLAKLKRHKRVVEWLCNNR